MSRAALLFSVVFVVFGCGGRRVEIDDDDAGSDAAAAQDVTVKPPPPPPPPSDAAPDRQLTTCGELMRDLDTAREALTRCCPACDSIQCNAMVEDLCCATSYTNQGPNAQIAQKFAELVRRFKTECGAPPCPPMPCPPAPSMNCSMGDSHCARQP